MNGCSKAHYVLDVWNGRDLQRCPVPQVDIRCCAHHQRLQEIVWRSDWKGRLQKPVDERRVMSPQPQNRTLQGLRGQQEIVLGLTRSWGVFPLDLVIYWIQCQIVGALSSRYRHIGIADFLQILEALHHLMRHWCLFAGVLPSLYPTNNQYLLFCLLITAAAAARLTWMTCTCDEKLISPSVWWIRLSSFVCWAQKVLHKIHHLFYLL